MLAQAFLKQKTEQVEAALRQRMQAYHGAPDGLIEAMAYSLFAGGKRLRPALALGACELICGDEAPALNAACALEMIHTYSLIHDDLPAMDNDDLRRGRPTAHCRFDEATAILSGDALLTMAFYELARTGRADVVQELAAAAGAAGMVGGQYLDMQAEGKSISLEELAALHARKTGALIVAALRLGAMLGGANDQELNALTGYGQQLGLLFQITDDILDVTGASEQLGKTIGKDQRAQKSTYPALIGLDASMRLARDTAQAARDYLKLFAPRAEIFHALAQYVLDRDR